MEAELEDERKQKAIAVNGRKKMEGDLKDLEQQVRTLLSHPDYYIL
jgi:hypothetical protein